MSVQRTDPADGAPSVGALREVPESVADRIADRMTDLTPSSRRIARRLLADYPAAGLGTVAALAQSSGVSPPTVTRFAASLGFQDFAEMQARLKDELRLRAEGPLSSPAWAPQPGSASQLLVERAEQLAEDAVRSLRLIPDEELEAATELLADSSRKVFLAGGRYSSSLAKHLATNLETVRPRVMFLADPFGSGLSHLVSLGSRDVVVLFDFHRYQRDISELARHVRRRGATILLITDERLSPAAAHAKVVLPVNVRAPSPFYSFSAGIMLVELLVVAVLQALGDKARQHMSTWDDFRSRELLIDPPRGAGAVESDR